MIYMFIIYIYIHYLTDSPLRVLWECVVHCTLEKSCLIVFRPFEMPIHLHLVVLETPQISHYYSYKLLILVSSYLLAIPSSLWKCLIVFVTKWLLHTSRTTRGDPSVGHTSSFRRLWWNSTSLQPIINAQNKHLVSHSSVRGWKGVWIPGGTKALAKTFWNPRYI